MKIFSTVKTNVKKAGHAIKVKSPEICLVVGVVAGIGAIVAACRAIRKVEPVLEDAKAEKERLEGFREAGEITFNVDAANDIQQTIPFDEGDYRKAVGKMQARTMLELGKIFALPIGLEALSVACQVHGYREQKSRLVEAIAYGASVAKALDFYRQNVIDDPDAGPEKDAQYRYGLQTEEVEEEIVDPETNKKKLVKRKESYTDDALTRYSEYARYFKPYDSSTGTGSYNYERNFEYNMAFIKRMIANCSTDYVVDDHFYLDKFWDALGYKGKANSDKKARRVGWSQNHPNCHSRDHITVDVRAVRRKVQEFNADGDPVYRYENWIVIDPRVDGMIDQYVYDDNIVEEDPNQDCPF